MTFFPQKKLFITWKAITHDGVGEGNLLFAPGVIPALINLRLGGYQLVLLGAPRLSEGGADQSQMLRILKHQGVVWDQTIEIESSPTLGAAELDKSPYFPFLQGEIWSQRLLRSGTFIVGSEGEAAGLAALLGMGYLAVNRETPWPTWAQELLSPKRWGEALRRTGETDIRVALDLGGDPKKSRITTGIGFFDHMLDQLSRHGGMTLTVDVKGDLEIDDHHTVEDTALALGEALRMALGDRRGIARYGFMLPMDEVLAQCALDLSGRPAFVFEGVFTQEKVGELSTEMVPHFFQSLSQTLGAAIHLSVGKGNAHHQVEGVFKVFAKSLGAAIRDTGETTVPSTKGVL